MREGAAAEVQAMEPRRSLDGRIREVQEEIAQCRREKEAVEERVERGRRRAEERVGELEGTVGDMEAELADMRERAGKARCGHTRLTRDCCDAGPCLSLCSRLRFFNGKYATFDTSTERERDVYYSPPLADAGDQVAAAEVAALTEAHQQSIREKHMHALNAPHMEHYLDAFAALHGQLTHLLPSSERVQWPGPRPRRRLPRAALSPSQTRRRELIWRTGWMRCRRSSPTLRGSGTRRLLRRERHRARGRG